MEMDFRLAHDFHPFFRVHKDGRVERYEPPDRVHPVPAGLNLSTGIESRDVVSPETGVSACIFVLKTDGLDRKLPLLVHYHGGGFCVGSPFDTIVNDILSTMVTRPVSSPATSLVNRDALHISTIKGVITLQSFPTPIII